MEINEKKSFTIFSQELAARLMLRGFVLIRTCPNRDRSGRNVFYFTNSQELQKAIYEIQSVNKN